MTRDEDEWYESFVKQLEIGRTNMVIQLLCRVCPTGAMLGKVVASFRKLLIVVSEKYNLHSNNVFSNKDLGGVYFCGSY